MPAFYGNALVIQFTGPGGTWDVSAYQRQVNFSPSIQLDDKSVGADTAKSYNTRQTDFTLSYKGLWQSGTAAVGASLEDAWAPGSVGTFTCWPQGSVAGSAYRKYTWPVISQGMQPSWSYGALTEINCNFQGNGAWTLGTGG